LKDKKLRVGFKSKYASKSKRHFERISVAVAQKQSIVRDVH
jgi:hypothetical protein